MRVRLIQTRSALDSGSEQQYRIETKAHLFSWWNDIDCWSYAESPEEAWEILSPQLLNKLNRVRPNNRVVREEMM